MPQSKSTTAPLIPREILFGNPTKASPQISPDGTRMAYLAPVDDVLNVWVGQIDADTYRPVTTDRDRGVRVYFWGYDGGTIYYLQDLGGDEDWSLYATNIDTAETKHLTPFDGVQVQILAYRKQFPGQMILALNRDDPANHDAYHLDLTTYELKKIAENPGNFTTWVVDADLQVRGATAATPEGGFELLIRTTVNDDWTTLITWDAEDGMASGPVGFTGDGKAIYLSDSRDANAARLVKLDLATGAVEVLAEDPDYDAADAIIHPDTREVQAVAFTRARQEWLVLDDTIADDVAAISRVNPGDWSLADRTAADDRWVIGFDRDVDSVSYYTFDRATKRGHFLFHTRPRLAQAELVPMEPIEFTARDGLTIHGYLTRPPTDGPLPMVLDVHGGPWHRDAWGYDAEAQWMANRGYACLQVNFRGSTGYGKAFVNAGDKEWGGRMHDDLIDAVEFAVKEGWADRNRIAIYGGSYGGYAALAGATFTPDVFRCAVDIVGPSNLLTFINTVPAYWESFLEVLYRRVGHPEKDEAFLRERSPLFHVDNIRIPMLIAQGANDPRVKQSESEQIVQAMRDKNIDHDYLLFPDEGHGFAKPENRLRFYAAAEKFLARHLGGRSED
jgi:dipeptidyl aminopeptidase/acylaminoacyl peptidase